MDLYSTFAYEVAVKLAGGKENLSQETLDSMAKVCSTSHAIKSFAGMYLVGDSARAEYNYKNLVGELRRAFKLTSKVDN